MIYILGRVFRFEGSSIVLKTKFLSYVLLFMGVFILLYPWLSEQYYSYQEKRLYESVELVEVEETEVAEEVDEVVNEQELINGFDQLDQLLFEQATSSTETEVVKEEKKHEPKAIAKIHIDKINLKLPILAGASQQNLKYAAAHMTETSRLGQIGNAAVAAHRAKTYGRLFNRLNELKIGDTIDILLKDQVITYTVFKVSVVDPKNISVLKRNNKDKILTLITCDPVNNPTHRLIVHAKAN